MLALEAFGYYSLAALVAGGLTFMTAPVSNAFYPRFTELVTRRDDRTLKEAYHLGAQLVTVLTGSAAVMLMFFSERILLLWTGDPELTGRVAPIMGVLALGSFLNCLMWVPYIMQLAHGWTSLTITVNTIAVALLVPTILWAVPIYGAIGVAWAWVALNVGYLVINIFFMHRRLLPSEKWRWYGQDIMIPLTATIAVAWLCRWMMPADLGRLIELGVLIVVSSGMLIVAALAAPLVRMQLAQHSSGRISTILGRRS